MCLLPTKDRPAWYTAATETRKFEAELPAVTEAGDGSLIFSFSYGNRELNEWTLQTRFTRAQFGPLHSVFLSEDRTILTGCTDSRTHYVYMADTSAVDAGVGLSCYSPRFDPWGEYVFFCAPWVRSAPPPAGRCAMVLDVSESRTEAYRVYPLSGDKPEKIALEASGGSNRWFEPPGRAIFDCYDRQGRVCTPLSAIVWDRDVDRPDKRIAFISQCTSRGSTGEYANDYELVILDLSEGLQSMRTSRFPMYFEGNIDTRQLMHAGLKWEEDGNLLLCLEPEDWVDADQTQYRLHLDKMPKQQNLEQQFFEVAEVIPPLVIELE
jgi:hypothetical protein